MTLSAKRTPLYDAHVAAHGRLVEFAGFEMPVQYTSVIAETKAVREAAGMFDVSHMARLWIRGARTLEFIEWVTTNDASEIEDGAGQYSLLPNESGGVVDDIIVYRVNSETFRMVVNASNHAKDIAWLKTKNSFGVEITDETEETAMIAVQGPKALSLIQSICDQPQKLASAPLFGLNEVEIGGVACFAPRSGYTGEDGFELICRDKDGIKLWNALLNVGVAPCGLGSRDILRVEAGLPLYGHELNDDMSPLCAGLGWVISKKKPFIGSEHVARVRAEGVPIKLQGIRLESKRVASPEMPVFAEGREIGAISSGIYSPTLECGLALAFLEPSVAQGTSCEIEIRGAREKGTIVNKRFLKG